MKPMIVKLNWTQYVNDGRVEALHGYCLFDEDVEVNCCELTPSYYLYPVGQSFTLKDKEQDFPEDLMDEEDCLPEPFYMHCKDVLNSPLKAVIFEEPDYEPGDYVGELAYIDDVIENLRCNHYWEF